MNEHILQDRFIGTGDMRSLYDALNLLPTSERADIVLIRSHVAYWSGKARAERAVIKPSRGHSYKVDGAVVRIVNHYDHRDGITGWRNQFMECIA